MNSQLIVINHKTKFASSKSFMLTGTVKQIFENLYINFTNGLEDYRRAAN